MYENKQKLAKVIPSLFKWLKDMLYRKGNVGPNNQSHHLPQLIRAVSEYKHSMLEFILQAKETSAQVRCEQQGGC